MSTCHWCVQSCDAFWWRITLNFAYPVGWALALYLRMCIYSSDTIFIVHRHVDEGRWLQNSTRSDAISDAKHLSLKVITKPVVCIMERFLQSHTYCQWQSYKCVLLIKSYQKPFPEQFIGFKGMPIFRQSANARPQGLDFNCAAAKAVKSY